MRSIVTLCLALFTLTAFSQDYYWVGGSGNWSDFSNHWATSSGGSTFHSSAPSSSNDVYFDVNSFTSTSQVVTVDVDADCNSMSWVSATNFPSIVASSNDLNVHGSLTLISDMTAEFDEVKFNSTSTGNTITSNGTSLGGFLTSIRFVGAGGEWSLQDNFDNFSILMEAGTLNTNSHDINLEDRFEFQTSGTKVINLGSSVITVPQWLVNSTNQTINAGTSKISASIFDSDAQGDGPFTYHHVELDGSNAKLRNTGTFDKITVLAGSELSLSNGDVFTVTSFVADGSKHEPIIIQSETTGSEATISKLTGPITLEYVELQDIHGIGGATFTANEAIDNGNNTGWTINPIVGLNYFWVGNGGNWSDFATHWATTSGGSTMHSDYPGKNDNVLFDGNSFSSTDETVEIDLDAECFDMDWSSVTNSPIINSAVANRLDIYGSMTFSNEVEKVLWNVDVNGVGAGHTVTYGNNGSINNLDFDGSGTYTLLDSLYTGITLSFSNGTINLNNQPIKSSSIEVLGSGLTFNMGSSNVYARNFKVQNSSSQPIINAGTSSIFLESFASLSGSLSIQHASISGFTFYNLTADGTIDLEGSNTYQNITIQPGSSVTLEDGETTIINGYLQLDGTKGAPISLNSSVSATQSTISIPDGTVDATYLIMQDIAATGGAIFNATQTIDNGNNTGWSISGLVGEEYYWVGNSGNWSDYENHWATTSGGSAFRTAVPGVLDDITFDQNSFNVADQIVTLDSDAANFNDLDASLSDENFTIAGATKEMNIYGSIELPSTATTDASILNFLSTEAETISFNDGPGASATANFISTGTWSLGSNFESNVLSIESGTFNAGSHDVKVNFRIAFPGTDNKTVNAGSSNFFARTWEQSEENLTFNGGTSELSFTSSFFLYNSAGNSITLYNLSCVNGSFSDNGSMFGDYLVNQFTIEAGKTLQPLQDVTLTTNDFVAVGTAGNPVVIEPQTGTSSLTISQASGTINGDYLELEEVTATGGAVFNAFNSIDNGNVVGWIFHRLAQTITFGSLPDKTFGDAPFELSATATSALPVSFSVISGPAIISGTTLTLTGAGTVQVRAEQAGDIDYDPAPSVIQSFDVASGGQTITFEALEEKDFDDASFELAGSSTSGLTISYASSNAAVATVLESTVTIVGIGTTTITASQVGNGDYTPAVSVDQDLIVAKADQIIAFDELPAKTFVDEDFELAATGGNSGNAVVFNSSNQAIAIVTGNTVSIVGVGVTTITADQDGTSNYNVATSVERILTVNKADQTISFEEISSKTYGDNGFGLSASVSSGLPISYSSSDESIASISNNTVTVNGAGVTTISASQVGNGNYGAATTIERDLSVAKANLTISVDDVRVQVGEVIPAFKLAYSGFVNGDDSEVIDVSPVAETTATSSSLAGEYTITLSGGEDNNYELSLTNGVLTIEGDALAIGEDLAFLRFYPNPTSRYLILESSVDANRQVEIRSMDGGLIMFKVIKSNVTQVDLSTMSVGTYLVVLKENERIIGTSRLIMK
ncbi:MAG: MBG domain-containing protein [Cyclobacteriaceae bacterium]